MLVTGGAGFIGSNFILHELAAHPDLRIVNVDALTYAGNLANLSSVAQDPRYAFIQADITNQAAMSAVFTQYNPNVVVNFAAESHVDRSIQTPELFAHTNVLGTVTLLEAARQHWVHQDPEHHRFIQISTDEVYGSLPRDCPDLLFTEKSPLAPRSPYAASKASADTFVLSYRDTYGMPVNITRCSNNYGPRQYPEKLIPLTISRALAHQPIPIYGDGRNVRDWIHVDDHCRAIDAVIQNALPGEIYNIGAREEHTNISLITTILDTLSKLTGDPDISPRLMTHVKDRPGHDTRYGLDISKIQRYLNWSPSISFYQGLISTIYGNLGA
ncbi:dTDP-glucose 4,6-dehydratase [Olsenella sp. KGMB02461]|nr:dTDP-glucose 4,6-dehydratase [Olsenella sp. KGMB02461]